MFLPRLAGSDSEGSAEGRSRDTSPASNDSTAVIVAVVVPVLSLVLLIAAISVLTIAFVVYTKRYVFKTPTTLILGHLPQAAFDY